MENLNQSVNLVSNYLTSNKKGQVYSYEIFEQNSLVHLKRSLVCNLSKIDSEFRNPQGVNLLESSQNINNLLYSGKLWFIPSKGSLPFKLIHEHADTMLFGRANGGN